MNAGMVLLLLLLLLLVVVVVLVVTAAVVVVIGVAAHDDVDGERDDSDGSVDVLPLTPPAMAQQEDTGRGEADGGSQRNKIQKELNRALKELKKSLKELNKKGA